jgi:LacI family transcriptional regulator
VVRQPAYEMGKKAAELLITMIESKRPVLDFETVILPAELIQRASSAKSKTVK